MRRSSTEWDKIYFRLRASRLGDDFPRERFLRTPTKTIHQVLVWLDDQEKREANIGASTTAQLAQLVMMIGQSFAGSKRRAVKIKPQDFLPFPTWRPAHAVNGPDAPTKYVLTELFKKRSLPPHIFTALFSDADN